MGILDDLGSLLSRANEAATRSMYDPSPSLEVDGIVTESDIPEDEQGWESPREYAYPHSDFTRDPGIEEQLLTENAVLPGEDMPAVKEDWRAPETGTPEAPDFSVDAPANVMSTAQYALNTNAVKILNPELRRITILIQNLSQTATVNLAGSHGGVATGIVLAPGQSIELSYCGELFGNATANGTLVSIAEFYRNRA